MVSATLAGKVAANTRIKEEDNMLYYKVKPEWDQFVINKNFDILIENRLYTQKEYEKINDDFLKMKRGNVTLKDKFEIVEIPKTKTYFFFGARFAMEDAT